MKRVLLSLAALALLAGAAGAEIEPQSVRWQLVSREKRESAKPTDVTQLPALVGDALPGRLFARVKLLNRGPATEGVLLRYALSSKIGPVDQTLEIQAIPFVVDEKRVPKIGANQFLEVAIDVTNHVNLQLKRLARDEYALRELRLQLMVAPRRGDRSAQTIESSISVAK